jgi:hypothetical protein
MGLRLFVTGKDAATKLNLTLICEGSHAPRDVSETFVGDQYVEVRKLAAEAGWKQRGRKWYGPCCRNK